MISIVVRVHLIGPVIVVTTLIILNAVFPIIRTFVKPARLPIGIVVRVHLIGPIVIISGIRHLLHDKLNYYKTHHGGFEGKLGN